MQRLVPKYGVLRPGQATNATYSEDNMINMANTLSCSCACAAISVLSPLVVLDATFVAKVYLSLCHSLTLKV